MSKHKKMVLSNTTYDFFKVQAQVVLPALGTFYFTISMIWGLPKAEEVVGTIVALDTLLGLILGYSSAKYRYSDARFDGVMHVGENVNTLELNDEVLSLEAKPELLFKVKTKKEVDE